MVYVDVKQAAKLMQMRVRPLRDTLDLFGKDHRTINEKADLVNLVLEYLNTQTADKEGSTEKDESSSVCSGLKELGEKCLEEKQYTTAIQFFDIALKLKPDDHDALAKRAEAYFKEGNFKQCVADCDECVELEPDSVEPHILKARSLISSKLYVEAHSACCQAMRRFPKNKDLKKLFEIVYKKM